MVALDVGYIIEPHVELSHQDHNVGAADRIADHRADVAEHGLEQPVALGTRLDVERAHLREVLERQHESHTVFARLREQCREVRRGVLGELVDVDEEGCEVGLRGVSTADTPVAAPIGFAACQNRVLELVDEPRAQQRRGLDADTRHGEIGDEDLALVDDLLDVDRALAGTEDAPEHTVALEGRDLGEEPGHAVLRIGRSPRARLEPPLLDEALVLEVGANAGRVVRVGEEPLEQSEVRLIGKARVEHGLEPQARHRVEARTRPIVLALALEQLGAVAHGLGDGCPVAPIDVERVQAGQQAGVGGVDDDHVIDAVLGDAHERVEGILLVRGDDGHARAVADVLALHLEQLVGLAASRPADDGRVAEAVLVELEHAALLALAERDAERDALVAAEAVVLVLEPVHRQGLEPPLPGRARSGRSVIRHRSSSFRLLLDGCCRHAARGALRV